MDSSHAVVTVQRIDGALAVSSARVPELELKNDDLRTVLGAAEARNTKLETTMKTERKNHAFRVEELTTPGAELENKFKVLAGEALGKNSKDFTKLVTERFEKHAASATEDPDKRLRKIENLVKPLGEDLAKFEHRVGELEKARGRLRGYCSVGEEPCGRSDRAADFCASAIACSEDTSLAKEGGLPPCMRSESTGTSGRACWEGRQPCSRFAGPVFGRGSVEHR